LAFGVGQGDFVKEDVAEVAVEGGPGVGVVAAEVDEAPVAAGDARDEFGHLVGPVALHDFGVVGEGFPGSVRLDDEAEDGDLAVGEGVVADFGFTVAADVDRAVVVVDAELEAVVEDVDDGVPGVASTVAFVAEGGNDGEAVAFEVLLVGVAEAEAVAAGRGDGGEFFAADKVYFRVRHRGQRAAFGEERRPGRDFAFPGERLGKAGEEQVVGAGNRAGRFALFLESREDVAAFIDLFEGVGRDGADALAVDEDVGDGEAGVRGDGEAVVAFGPGFVVAGGADRAAVRGLRFDEERRERRVQFFIDEAFDEGFVVRVDRFEGLEVPDAGAASDVFDRFHVGDGHAEVAGFDVVVVDHRAGGPLMGPLVGEDIPPFAVGGVFDEVLVEVFGVFELEVRAFDFLDAPHVDLDPFVHLADFGAPEGGVVVVGGVAGEVRSLVRGGRDGGGLGEVRVFVLALADVADALVGGFDRFNLVVFGEDHRVDAGLAGEAAGRDPDVVAVVDHEVVVVFLQDAVVAGAVDVAFDLGGEDRVVLAVGPAGVCGGAGFVDRVSDVVGFVVAGCVGVHHVIFAVALEHVGGFHDAFELAVGDASLAFEGFHVVLELDPAGSGALEAGPGGEVAVGGAVVVLEGLDVERDDRGDELVWDEGLFAEGGPGAERAGAFGAVDLAGVVVEEVVLAVFLHAVGGPVLFVRLPAEFDVDPVDEVFGDPGLGPAFAGANAVGRGIEVVEVAELLEGRVGEVAGDDRIEVADGVPGGVGLGLCGFGVCRAADGEREEQQGDGECTHCFRHDRVSN